MRVAECSPPVPLAHRLYAVPRRICCSVVAAKGGRHASRPSLIRTIEMHAEELTRELLDDLGAATRARLFHGADARGAAQPRLRHVYSQPRRSGGWPRRTSATSRRSMRTSAAAGTTSTRRSASLLLYVVILIRMHPRSYIARIAAANSAVEMHPDAEPERLDGHFFPTSALYRLGEGLRGRRSACLARPARDVFATRIPWEIGSMDEPYRRRLLWHWVPGPAAGPAARFPTALAPRGRHGRWRSTSPRLIGSRCWCWPSRAPGTTCDPHAGPAQARVRGVARGHLQPNLVVNVLGARARGLFPGPPRSRG